MADQKLSDLPALPTPIASGDLLYVVRSGTDYKGTNTDLPAGTVTNVTGTAPIASSGGATPAISLNDTAVTIGSYGSATKASTFTVDQKGRLTAAAEATVTPAVGSITGLGTGVGTALAINVGTAGAPVVLNGAGGTPSSMVGTNITGTAAGLTAGNVTTNANLTGDVTSVGNTTTLAAGNAGVLNSGTLLAARMPALTGDITTSAGAVATTLATVNSNVGTFGSATKASVVTVNGKGLVTAASESTVTPAVGSITGLGTGVGTFLATPSSANLAAALTDETGSGAAVFATSPILVTPLLGTPTSGTLTSCTGLPIATGVSGLGSGVATFLATASSANLASAVTDETGSGALVFGTDPALTVSTPTTTSFGYLGVPQNSKSAAYTTVMADSGKHIYHPSADTTARTWTIDSNANVAYPIGTAITFINDTSGGVITIAITSDTLVLAGAGTTGSRSLAANGIATAVKMTSTRWIINGTGLT